MTEKRNKKKPYQRRTLKNFVLALASALGIGVVLTLFILAVGINQENQRTEQSISEELQSEFNNRSLSEEVKAYEPIVQEELKKRGKEEYLDVVLALMMQESGGKGDDPMQASESLCGGVGCIDDPEVSIEHGVEHFTWMIDQTDGDLKLALQAYNFGGGFLDFVENNGGEYTEELAIEYSQQMYEQLSSQIDFRCIRDISEELNACYGDIKYVDAVLAYYADAKEHTEQDVELSMEK